MNDQIDFMLLVCESDIGEYSLIPNISFFFISE